MQMLGDESHPGIIPRSMQQIFDGIQKLEKDGWTFKLQVSTIRSLPLVHQWYDRERLDCSRIAISSPPPFS